MSLANFIRDNTETILQEWEDYAYSLKQGKSMSVLELRDHAHDMLISIAEDLNAPQSQLQQDQKAKGKPSYLAQYSGLIDATASKHALDRFHAGFSIQDLVSEFRALRACVLRLWEKRPQDPKLSDLNQIRRFNESIDQLLAESVAVYAGQKERNIRLFETILLSSPDHNYILDLDGVFLYANKALVDELGKSDDEVIGKNINAMDLLQIAELQKAIKNVLKQKSPVRGEIEYQANSGHKKLYEYILTPIFDANHEIEVITGTERDVTDRKSSEDAVWHQANYDSLTQLPNRGLFQDRLAQQINNSVRTGKLAALFFIDLDYFKIANDTFGHVTGDQLLIQVAVRIRSCIRKIDTLARIGGDEFTVILADFEEINHVSDVATKILSELAKPFVIYNNEVHISGSIGISLISSNSNNLENLINQADRAMYDAKNKGRNQFSF